MQKTQLIPLVKQKLLAGTYQPLLIKRCVDVLQIILPNDRDILITDIVLPASVQHMQADVVQTVQENS